MPKLTKAIDYGATTEAIMKLVVYGGLAVMLVVGVARLIWGG